ncbi:MAG: hypothetical protein ACR2HV_01930 [Acidimicrobiales bacterium]
MSSSQAGGIYRGLLRFYPRRFRDEYGIDMAHMFADQLRDEPAGRVWARGVVDLAITIPARHLEAHMNRPPNPAVPLVFAAVSISGVVFAMIGGSNPGMLGLGLAVAVVAGLLALAAWRHTRAVSTARPATAHWWQVLLVGVGVLATTIVVLNVVGEVSEDLWLPMMLTLLAGVVTTASGIFLGVARLTEERPAVPRTD